MLKSLTYAAVYLAAAYIIGLTFRDAFGQEMIVGRASVIDGDTLDIHGQRIRLHGVDAPESSQTCEVSGTEWRCGQQAALALSDFVAQSPVSCVPQTYDRYGRTVAKCSVRGADIEEWLVSNGYAMAYRKYSSDYIAAETSARERRVGIWRGSFIPPWDYRHGKKRSRSPFPDFNF